MKKPWGFFFFFLLYWLSSSRCHCHLSRSIVPWVGLSNNLPEGSQFHYTLRNPISRISPWRGSWGHRRGGNVTPPPLPSWAARKATQSPPSCTTCWVFKTPQVEGEGMEASLPADPAHSAWDEAVAMRPPPLIPTGWTRRPHGSSQI